MSELYFFKMLMKADTGIAFGEEFVVLDSRETPVFKKAETQNTAAGGKDTGDGTV